MIRQKMLSTPHIPNAIMASTNYSGEEEKKEED
jgi:hypothetical protein